MLWSGLSSALEEKQYGDAVVALNEILDRGDTEDFFLSDSPEDGGTVSLKQRARQLLGSMPRAGREIYELQVGSEARRLLEQAIERFDIDGIREVSRRFFHSRVGYEATMLLARFELDQGMPLAAAMHLERLRRASVATANFDAELPLLLAVCWYLAGQDEVADRVLA